MSVQRDRKKMLRESQRELSEKDRHNLQTVLFRTSYPLRLTRSGADHPHPRKPVQLPASSKSYLQKSVLPNSVAKQVGSDASLPKYMVILRPSTGEVKAAKTMSFFSNLVFALSTSGAAVPGLADGQPASEASAGLPVKSKAASAERTREVVDKRAAATVPRNEAFLIFLLSGSALACPIKAVAVQIPSLPV